MSDAYLITSPDDRDQDGRYTISTLASFTIGSVLCPDCDGGAWVPFAYPSFDLSVLSEDITRHLKRFIPDVPYGDAQQGPNEITLEQMRDLSTRLATLLGPSRPFGPGTGLGPSLGTAEGRFADFCWQLAPSDVFLRRSVLDAMRAAGFGLTAISGGLRYRREREDPLVELEILPGAHMHEALRHQTCETCGFASTRPKYVRLEAAGFDRSIPIQRVWESPGLLIASAEFADFIREQAFTGIRITPIILE